MYIVSGLSIKWLFIFLVNILYIYSFDTIVVNNSDS